MNNFLFSFGLVFVCLFDLRIRGQSTVCDSDWACYDDTIDNENVYCRGYAACYGANITAEEYTVMTGGYTGISADITAEYNAYCYGLYACLDTTMEVTNDFYNYGFASCAYSDVNIGDDYFSRGMYSGYDLTIDGEDYSYIQGLFGGAFSTMTDFVRTYNYGLFSLYYADVYSPGNATETVYFISYGYYSGYYTDFYCQGDDYCRIYCDSTGCDELTVYVEDTASYKTSCSSTCAECPTVTSYSSLEELQKTESYMKRQELKKQRYKWFDEQLGLADGIQQIESFVKETKKSDIKSNAQNNNFHTKIYQATRKARKQKGLVNEALRFHKLEGNDTTNSTNSSMKVGLSVVNTIPTLSSRNVHFGVDIISFIVGVGGTLALGVSFQYGLKNMQQK